MIFPEIDPIAFSIGPLAIRWYALAYLTGFLAGWWYGAQLLKRYGQASPLRASMLDDLMPYVVIGVILGGRIGYILAYNPMIYWHNPGDIAKVWQGGMSFHGGLVGSITGMFLFALRRKLPFLSVTDMAAAVVPIGLFFGRIANFINGELFGRPTDLDIGMVFPGGGDVARHPSQLYEAALEGALLFAILFILARRKDAWKAHGLLSGVFMCGYAASRFVVEFAREPDPQVGYVFTYFTLGQLFCIPMFVAGLYILNLWKKRRDAAPV